MMEAARTSAADHDRVGADRNGADAEETCTAAAEGAVAGAEVPVTAAEVTVTAAEVPVTAVTKTVPPERRLVQVLVGECPGTRLVDRKSTRLNSSHLVIS